MRTERAAGYEYEENMDVFDWHEAEYSWGRQQVCCGRIVVTVPPSGFIGIVRALVWDVPRSESKVMCIITLPTTQGAFQGQGFLRGMFAEDFGWVQEDSFRRSSGRIGNGRRRR